MNLKLRNIPAVTGFVVLNYIGFAIVNNLPWSFLKDIEIATNKIIFQEPIVGLFFNLLILIFP